MLSHLTENKLAQPLSVVKSTTFTPLQLPLLPDIPPRLMTAHSNPRNHIIKGNRDKVWKDTAYYGCSRVWRSFSPQKFLKRFDKVRDALNFILGLTAGERECILNCLRLGAYYGKVYPKAAAFAEYPGCSESTFRRAVRKLKNRGLLTVIPRHLQPFRRQISNLLIFDKLLILIFRYLAEHGAPFLEKWLQPYIIADGAVFWDWALGGCTAKPVFSGGGGVA